MWGQGCTPTRIWVRREQRARHLQTLTQKGLLLDRIRELPQDIAYSGKDSKDSAGKEPPREHDDANVTVGKEMTVISRSEPEQNAGPANVTRKPTKPAPAAAAPIAIQAGHETVESATSSKQIRKVAPCCAGDMTAGERVRDERNVEMSMNDFWQYIQEVRQTPRKIITEFVPMTHGRLYIVAGMIWRSEGDAKRALRDLNGESVSTDSSDSTSEESEGANAADEGLLDFDEQDANGEQKEAKEEPKEGAEDKKESYAAIHASGLRDFLLKPEWLRAIVDCGFEHPSEVQHESISQAISGTDVLCQARSGMGETAVLVLACLQRINAAEKAVKVLVICHTRELAHQIKNEFDHFAKVLPGCADWGC